MNQTVKTAQEHTTKIQDISIENIGVFFGLADIRNESFYSLVIAKCLNTEY